MPRAATLSRLLALALLAGLTPLAAHAKGSYLSAFESRYPDSALADKLGCSLCHPGDDTGRLNAYGSAFSGRDGSTSSRLAQIESADSDKDGFTNLQEINAGTDPSNAKSRPASVTPTPTPTPTPAPTPTPSPTPIPTSNYDLQIMERMVDLHAMGVRLASVAETRASKRDFRAFARNFASREQAEMEIMLDWLSKWYGVQYLPQLEAGFDAALIDYRIQAGREFDLEFLEGMMAYECRERMLTRQALRRATNSELRGLADSMVNNDKKEMNRLAGWLKIAIGAAAGSSSGGIDD